MVMGIMKLLPQKAKAGPPTASVVARKTKAGRPNSIYSRYYSNYINKGKESSTLKGKLFTFVQFSPLGDDQLEQMTDVCQASTQNSINTKSKKYGCRYFSSAHESE
jgi:hypothetical protein